MEDQNIYIIRATFMSTGMMSLNKQITSYLTVTALILASLASLTLMTVTVSGSSILHVGGAGPGNYTSIQTAINDTVPGDTVFVHNGTYYENLYINKSINLYGENSTNTVIDGQNLGHIIVVQSNSTNISGLSLINAVDYTGLYFQYTTWFGNVTDMIISDVKYGIRMRYSNDMYFINMINVSVFNSSIGIYLYEGAYYRVTSCNIVNSGVGIYTNGYQNIIENNTISDCYDGVRLEMGWGEIVQYNIIDDCVNGICTYTGPSDFIFRNNTIKNIDVGIYNVWPSATGTIYHNNFINYTSPAYQVSQFVWDIGYPGGGNYWDNYTGVDGMSGPLQNSPPADGIGDTPYALWGTQFDNYPLMRPTGNAPDTYNIPLVLGWNLISIPLDLSSHSIDDVTASIAGKWDYILTYEPGVPDPWLSNSTAKPDSLNDLNTMDIKHGFWINVTDTGQSLDLTGFAPYSTTISLKAGWNLVGYPSLTPRQVQDALAGTSYTEVERQNTSMPYNVEPMAASDMMGPGEGYWVKVSTDVDWTVNL